MIFTKPLMRLTPLALLLALAACGGGAGSSGSVVPSTPSISSATTDPVSQTTPSPSPSATAAAAQATPTPAAWNGAYAFSTNLSSTYPLLQQTASSNTYLDRRIVTSDPLLANIVHTYKLADSLVAMSAISSEKPGAQFAIYDIEHWTNTPLSEQQNPAASIAQASQIAHAAGKKFGIAPDGRFMGVINGRCTSSVAAGIAYTIDWKQVDLLNIQAQALATNGECATAASYASFVQSIANIARSQNPNIEIMAQVSLRDSTPAMALQAARSVKGIVNGIYVAYPAPCTLCTLSNLSAILTGLH